MRDLYSQIASRIIERQETIIGPLAVEQARTVPDLTVNWANRTAILSRQDPEIIDELVERYKQLFGRVSVEVCKDATARLVAQLPADKQPKSLR